MSKRSTLMEGPLYTLAVPHSQLPSRLYIVLGPGHHLKFERQYNPNYNWDELSKQGIEPEYYKILGGLRSHCRNPLGCPWTKASITKISLLMSKYFDPKAPQPLSPCFIRTFSNYDDALCEAQRYEHGTGVIFHIDTTTLALPEMEKMVPIIRPCDLHSQWPKDQFLFFHQIPLAALTHMTEIPLEMMRQRIPNLRALRALPIQDFHPAEEAPAPNRSANPEHVRGRTARESRATSNPGPAHERTETEGSAPILAPELARNKPKKFICQRYGTRDMASERYEMQPAPSSSASLLTPRVTPFKDPAHVRPPTVHDKTRSQALSRTQALVLSRKRNFGRPGKWTTGKWRLHLVFLTEPFPPPPRLRALPRSFPVHLVFRILLLLVVQLVQLVLGLVKLSSCFGFRGLRA
ncbi:hypothetical protein B0T20DRAFT_389361 [Sordaria brevicollis]|uniref:Uncharacterized protein n=1 Tax=Sordaria brevicollis TaxID=83679 RepID=A0AAE0PK54_SORBR|nr:hypothetical protein B0T20DRAFT_389361 [Sordaria brevicollis]